MPKVSVAFWGQARSQIRPHSLNGVFGEALIAGPPKGKVNYHMAPTRESQKKNERRAENLSRLVRAVHRSFHTYTGSPALVLTNWKESIPQAALT